MTAKLRHSGRAQSPLSCSLSSISITWTTWRKPFLWSAPVAFRRVALKTPPPEWTSRDSNHHRQSVSAGKTNAIPTEPSGRLRPGGSHEGVGRKKKIQHQHHNCGCGKHHCASASARIDCFFSSSLTDVALRLGPYMSISCGKDVCTRTQLVHLLFEISSRAFNRFKRHKLNDSQLEVVQYCSCGLKGNFLKSLVLHCGTSVYFK